MKKSVGEILPNSRILLWKTRHSGCLQPADPIFGSHCSLLMAPGIHLTIGDYEAPADLCICRPEAVHHLKPSALPLFSPRPERQQGFLEKQASPKPTGSTGDPGHVLGLGRAIATLLAAPTSGRPRGAYVDLTHFEEGHHEWLLVIRAISAHQACGSGVNAESWNVTQSTPPIIPRKPIPAATVHNSSHLASHGQIIKMSMRGKHHALSGL